MSPRKSLRLGWRRAAQIAIIQLCRRRNRKQTKPCMARMPDLHEFDNHDRSALDPPRSFTPRAPRNRPRFYRILPCGTAPGNKVVQL